jgi:hypothetical protein
VKLGGAQFVDWYLTVIDRLRRFPVRPVDDLAGCGEIALFSLVEQPIRN